MYDHMLADPTELASYDAASDTYLDPDAPITVCVGHTARDIDARSGRCYECGEHVVLELRA